MKVKTLSVLLGLTLVGATPAIAQVAQFDLAGSCTATLKNHTGRVPVWASGYLSGLEGELRPLDRASLDKLSQDLLAACTLTPRAPFATIVEQLAQGQGLAESLASGGESAMPPNVPEIGRPLVEKFLASDLDLVEVLRSLRPTQEEIEILYPEEIARKLDAIYEGMFGDTLDREGFPSGPVEVETGFTTTFELEQAPFADELPGGFRRLFDVFLVDVPFGYIDVVFTKEQDNMKLSGFVYVNNRWVLMSRPWRALD